MDGDFETNADIIEAFETLVSDAPDSTMEIRLLRQADTLIRRARMWEILKKLDATKTRTSGDSYTTAKTNPTDFDRPYKMFIGNQRSPLKRIKFEDQFRLRSLPGCYFIDYKNNNYYITDGTQEGTIENFYIYKPDILTLENLPVFPEDFLMIYAYKMAEIQMGGIDEDDRAVAAVPQWVRSYRELWDTMVNWDTDLKDQNILSETYADDIPPVDLGLLGSELA